MVIANAVFLTILFFIAGLIFAIGWNMFEFPRSGDMGTFPGFQRFLGIVLMIMSTLLWLSVIGILYTN
jgi:hypothetical protein